MSWVDRLFAASTDASAILPPGETEQSYIRTFDRQIDWLRHECPSPYVRNICQLAYRAIGMKVVPLGVSRTDAPSLGLLSNVTPGHERESILWAPPNWASKCRANEHWGRGSIVYIASQIADHLHKHWDKYTKRRAWAYEAEYYVCMRRQGHQVPLDEYQTQVLADYPQGLRSLPLRQYYVVQPLLVKGDFVPLPRWK